MATIADISQVLGNYMLRGWVLTDQPCPTPGCTVPMLRSPKGSTSITTFCVKCNNEKPSANNSEAAPSSNTSLGSPHSLLSTPPTEFSSGPGSPVFMPLEESEESRRRRAQSDQASSEIGKRLLKGWAMLGDECPNSTCYGVPLVRPPKPGPDKDPKKECVVCGRVYVKDVDWAGRENLVLQSTKTSDLSTRVQFQAGSSSTGHAGSLLALPFPSPFNHEVTEAEQKIPVETVQVRSSVPVTKPTSLSTPLENGTLHALKNALQALTGRLTTLSSQSILDPISIGTTADAITKIALALGQVQQLQTS